MVRIVYLILIVLVACPLCGCVESINAEPTAQVSVEERRFDDLIRDYPDVTYRQLAEQIPRREYVDRLTFDPAKAKYFDETAKRLQLTDIEREMLQKSGFVSIDHGQRYSFGSLYFAVYSNDLPVLITTDSILHAMHCAYDDILMEIEQTLFTDVLGEVLRKCHEELGNSASSWGATAANYRDVDLYLTVARNLLRGASAPAGKKIHPRLDAWNGRLLVSSKLGQDQEVLQILESVRSLKLQTGGHADSTSIYGGARAIDYSQFQPRGHYLKTAPLSRYFRAMIWLGRPDTGWNLLPPDPQSGIVSDTPRELRNAVILTKLLESTKSVEGLRQMNQILAFMVGESDNLSVFQMIELLGRQQVDSAGDLTWGSQVSAFQDALRKGGFGEQHIRGQWVESDPTTLDQVAPPSLFQMFGQRFTVDSFVLSKVVYDSIIFDGNKVERRMPQGIDLMYALGNDTVLPLLEPELDKFPYASNLKASREFVGQFKQPFWQSNLYNIWLDSIRALDDDRAGEQRLPETMRTEAWQRKQLQTQLASWAELRHDTMLYAKQSYTAEVSCEYPTGFVEPYPEVYARIKFFAEEGARRIEAADYGTAENDLAEVKRREIEFFEQMAKTLGKLEILARKELASEPFSDEDQHWLKQAIDIRSRGSGMPQYTGWYCQLFYSGGRRSAEWDPTVVDVHTDLNSQAVLEVAVGDCNFLVAAIDNEDDHMIYVGPAYSYYEFRQPAATRLTDQQWRQMLRNKEAPSRPGWTKSFQSPMLQRHAGRPELE